MPKKKYLISAAITIAVVVGIFLFGGGKTTFYIKNSAPHLRVASIHQKLYQAEDRIGDLSNNAIPKITVPENLTKNLAELLAKSIIDKNNQPKDPDSSAEPRLNMPDPNKIAEEFIVGGLKKANENILNIKLPEIKTSPDNSKKAVEIYLTETQKILKDNLGGEPLMPILEDINQNNGKGLEKLLPIISGHEAAANQIEETPVPSSLKDLITEEIRLLRITANILKALTSIENDPLGAIAATKQFEALFKSWLELQQKFNVFVEKINKI